jgi:hypothetical protein
MILNPADGTTYVVWNMLTDRRSFESQPTAEQLRLGDPDHSLLRSWIKHFAKTSDGNYRI